MVVWRPSRQPRAANNMGGRRIGVAALVNTGAVEILEGQKPPDRAPMRFHRCLPGYEETPLVDAPALADALGVGKVLVKDESSWLGLPAFKVLGASWAVYRSLEERLPEGAFGHWETLEELKERLAPLRPLNLVAATDGNHGRALARVARLLGLGARIFVPEGMAAARREAIAGEGAEVIVVEGTYDEAIHHGISLPKIACRTLYVPVQGAPEPRPVSERAYTGSLEALFTGARGRGILRSSAHA